jgi:succinate dehydrogenase/fumarate reductase flavoprotein subunit
MDYLKPAQAMIAGGKLGETLHGRVPMEAWPIVNNTQGGPEHDVKQRVLDPMKKPIPRLYVAGEISSIYGHLYLEAGNITECFVAGKIAGQNAAEEQAWS